MTEKLTWYQALKQFNDEKRRQEVSTPFLEKAVMIILLFAS